MSPENTTPKPVSAAARGTYVAFIGCGFAFASWASRIPQVRDQLHLTPASLGLVLLAIAAGSLTTLPLSGAIINRLNSRRTVTAMSILLSVALAVVAMGYLLGVVPVVIGLFLLGFANGAWDPAMNVQGAVVERHLRRSIMSRFHAGYSIGTVAGALLGAAMVALHIPVTIHLILVAAVVIVVVPFEVRRFLPDANAVRTAEEPASSGRTGGPLVRWLEPRTVLIGVFVLAFAFTEGTGVDWISVAVIDGYHTLAATGTLAFAVFLAGMTGARWFGPGLLHRFGRVVTVRSLAVVAVIGLLLFVFGHVTPLAFVGAFLWGVGASLGFPVGMSAASDDPLAAASRVSVVASIGYCAFLGGPPLIGFLGNQFAVLNALTAVAVLLTLSVLLAGSLHPLPVRAGAPVETTRE